MHHCIQASPYPADAYSSRGLTRCVLNRIARLLLLALLLSGLGGRLWAAPSPQQRNKANAADSLVKKVERLYKAKKFDEAGQALNEAQKLLTDLEGDENAKQAAPLTAALRKTISKAHGLLEKEGVKLEDLPAAPAAAPAGGKSGGGKVSFTKQVAPVLVAKCGRCHIDKSSGEFSMATYNQLAKGSKDGIVFFPGTGKTSRMIELIEQGDMPRGDPKITPDELAMLIRWIDEGGKFDGADPAARISGGAAPVAKRQPAMTKVEVAQATGKEDVQFARDIGPVLMAQCVDCHGGRNPRARLSFETFTRVLQGSENGPVVEPGKGSDSLIVKKLRGGGGGTRMPMGKPPLDDATIAKFEKWIADGAKFDGPDPNSPLAILVAMIHAKLSTHEQLSRERAELASKNWRLILPDASPEKKETEHFVVFGNVGEKQLDEIARLAEEQVPKIEKTLKVTGEGPFIKGRMTIYAFGKHYDYDEVGNMLEQREIPPGGHGHWRYNVVDAYGCVVAPKSTEYSMAALLCAEIASVYVASQGGDVPHWFGEGAGRAVASRIYGKDGLIRQWDERMSSSIAASEKPDDFIKGTVDPDAADVLSYGFVKSLVGNAKFSSALAALRAGTPFEQAFNRAFGGPPAQLAAGWLSRGATKRGR